MAVRDQDRVMRSIGITPRTILSLLLCKSLLIGLLGGILGCGAACLVLKLFLSAVPLDGWTHDSADSRAGGD
ncbi:MAG: FtsX-like permease family protein [Candidatus Binatus sp.]|uniref:FtsX-like permease family protein n=1 Tax=Candidatus Binatus sp. TaxID=2811406 RepID=UPI0027240C96|nr:FtsX-like permease family protein [Candidatus Binatus sp.]MDO8432462.1 FtsX-like permease family protein [Candidatus Binatus sp.]